MITLLQRELTAKLYSKGFVGKWRGTRENPQSRFYFSGETVLLVERRRRAVARVWLAFENPATLEGPALQITAAQEWQRTWLLLRHYNAFLLTLSLTDPILATELAAEIAANFAAAEPVDENEDWDEDWDEDWNNSYGSEAGEWPGKV